MVRIFDGQCSGAIIKFKHPDCEMIGVDYGDPLPIDDIAFDEEIFVVDFSFPVLDMHYLTTGTRLTWIDHHKTAVEKMSEMRLTSNTVARVEDGKAGCELTWELLYPDTPTPTAVRLLGRYDVWDHDADYRVLPFQYGMRRYITDPDNSDIWHPLLINRESADVFIARICKDGYAILDYVELQDKRAIPKSAFEIDFHGLKCIALNTSLRRGSQLFDSVWDPKKYDAMLVFGKSKGKWTVSMYTDKPEIDVSEVCKDMGGGGHKQAAGFVLTDNQLVDAIKVLLGV